MLDLAQLRAAVVAHGPLVRVVVAGHEGSSPREAGAEMLVWQDGQSGTIGGGTLEFEAVARARALLERSGAPVLTRIPLGPALGQCCGGSVSLVSHLLDAAALAAMEGQALVATGQGEMPLAVRRLLSAARGQGQSSLARLVEGWLVEPVTLPKRQLWIWGAGHVGRAMVAVFEPLPDFEITWIDTSRARFPEAIPESVTPIWSERPEALAAHAPPNAEHLILTYSHALDLELCHRLLGRGFDWLGLIGSATKWARFRSRLRGLGHQALAIDRITCPIGDRSLGKHPQAIAIGVAVQLMNITQKSETEITGDRDSTGRKQRGQPA
ncbi:xanthine dehydrogenase accessory protein XdhC [Xinfangfangia sp. CPCC 101601]|uniref:Xanthine dehydrogenase accessory protein XdhC n=1 Tax=Pseudogemmobacter lacusdianii TaxID=3069608 RepID=A0ABU0VYV9_9RHOB|nr:xanthine dehydrogenase accessory protein XdhC [Xinfangfangia sp. CPCC 101601]MDQ2066937.1 xanthine dehydrogenase accessory protein XdhC [Xinfangfangia sp. CPCC 101601]